jgi:uncharacterized protein YceK
MELIQINWYLIFMKLLLKLFCLTLLFLLIFSGCSVYQQINLNSDYSGTLHIEGVIDGFASGAFDDLAVLAGFDNSDDFYAYAENETKNSMEKRSDIKYCRISRPEKNKWTADIGFSDIQLLLSGSSSVVNIESGSSTEKMTLRFNRENADYLEKIVPVLENQAFAIFNPAELRDIDENTYINDILGFTFGEENIPAIKNAEITLKINLPGKILSVTGGKKTSENTAVFSVPLTRIMIPEKEILWSLKWEK